MADQGRDRRCGMYEGRSGGVAGMREGQEVWQV